MPIGLVVDGANRHDMKLTESTLESVVIERPEPTPEHPQNNYLAMLHFACACITFRAAKVIG